MQKDGAGAIGDLFYFGFGDGVLVMSTNAAEGYLLSSCDTRPSEVGIIEPKVVGVVRLDLNPVSGCDPFVCQLRGEGLFASGCANEEAKDEVRVMIAVENATPEAVFG